MVTSQRKGRNLNMCVCVCDRERKHNSLAFAPEVSSCLPQVSAQTRLIFTPICPNPSNLHPTLSRYLIARSMTMFVPTNINLKRDIKLNKTWREKMSKLQLAKQEYGQATRQARHESTHDKIVLTSVPQD